MNWLKRDKSTDSTTLGPSPTSLTRNISTPSRRYRAQALTKEEVTTNESLYYWKQKYEDLVHYLRESGVTEEEADHDECIRLLAEWNGNIKDAVLNGEKGRAWKKAHLPIARSLVLPTLQTGKFVYAGYDKVGRAVMYYRVKLHEPKKFDPLTSVLATVYLYEQLAAEGKLGPAGELCVVVDRTDSKSSNMDIEFLKLLFSLLKDAYPARGELFLVLGVNFVFRKIWENLVSVFIDAKSRSATHLLKDQTELLEYIDEDQLVDFCGGKLKYEFVPPKE